MIRKQLISSLIIAAVSAALCGSAVGCAGEVKLGKVEVKTPEPAPTPTPTPTPEPPPPPPEPPKLSLTGGATLLGNQIKIPGKIQFAFNKAVIDTKKKESNDVLDSMATILKSNNVTKCRIEGHTDNAGKPEYNQKLSQERAEAVVKWLVDHGVDKSSLEPVGHGATQPADASNPKADVNRRVEFHILQIAGKDFAPSSDNSSPAPAPAADQPSAPATASTGDMTKGDKHKSGDKPKPKGGARH